jgi:hypothetical protein
MRHPFELLMMKRLVRARICPKCEARPPGSERFNSTVPRPCEPACPLFVHLAQLGGLAAQTALSDEPAPGRHERAIKEVICSACQLSPTSGEYCSEYMTRTCPLSIYGGEVIAALEDLVLRRHDIDRPPLPPGKEA